MSEPPSLEPVNVVPHIAKKLLQKVKDLDIINYWGLPGWVQSNHMTPSKQKRKTEK